MIALQKNFSEQMVCTYYEKVIKPKLSDEASPRIFNYFDLMLQWKNFTLSGGESFSSLINVIFQSFELLQTREAENLRTPLQKSDNGKTKNEKIKNENEKLKNEYEKIKTENERLKIENHKIKNENQKMKQEVDTTRGKAEELEGTVKKYSMETAVLATNFEKKKKKKKKKSTLR
eukprot:Trichotokara_eunicae@DN3139_c0_g1_i4.p1